VRIIAPGESRSDIRLLCCSERRPNSDLALNDRDLRTIRSIINIEFRAYGAHDCKGCLDVKRPCWIVSDSKQRLPSGQLDATSVLFFWHSSPIKTLRDLQAHPASVGITAVNDVPAYRLRAMNRLLDTRIKLVPGYPSARDFVLASERGETDGGTSTYIGLAQIFSSYLAEKKLNILVQFAARRDRLMPDIPTVMELTRDPRAVEIFRLLIATDEIGRSLFTTPHVPPERIALLRSAFQMMLADPEFRTEAEQLKLPLAPRAGDELQQIVADTFKVTPATMTVLKEVIRP